MIERGRLTRIDGAAVYVEIARLGPGLEWGPCDVVGGIPGGAAAGDPVLVAAVGGIADDVVVLGFIG